MLFALFFFSISTERRRISEILIGNWSVKLISPPEFVPEDPVIHHLLIQREGKTNILSGILDNTESFTIETSIMNLTGKIYYLDYEFDYTFFSRATPFISADVDFNDLGQAHFALSSFDSFHITWIYNGVTYSLFAESFIPEDNRSWIEKNWKNSALFILCVIGYTVFMKISISMNKEIIEDKEKEAQNENNKKESEEEDKNEKDESKGKEKKDDKKDNKKNANKSDNKKKKDKKLKKD